MRRLAFSLAASLLLLGSAVPAFAEVNQPSNGEESTGRNAAGFGGGPHCHVIAVEASEQAQFDFIRVFPSHTGHANAGGDIFTADPDCDGMPGVTAP